jgi:hypothetical protein
MVSANVLSWLPWQLRGVAEEYSHIPTIKLFMPLYENHPIDGEKPLAFRWRVSLGSTF